MAPDSVTRRPRRHRWRWRILWVAVTLVLWGLASALLLASAADDARAGEAALRTIADLDDPTEIDLMAVERSLTEGERYLQDAAKTLVNPVLLPVRILPIAGRQWRSARALVEVSGSVVAELQPIVSEANQIKQDPNAADKVAFLRDVEAGLGRLQTVVAEADLGPSDGLVAPLAEARSELATRLLDLEGRADQYRSVTAGLASFLDGGTFLLLGSNNAEMRVGSGMHLSVGRLTVADGDFDLPGLTSSEDLAPIEGAQVLDADVAARWGFLGVDDDFRKLGYSARFDEHVAPQALELWEAATGERLDGVVLLDPFVFTALLGVLGPIELEGETYDETNVLDYLLQEQYEAFDIEADGREATLERRDRLSVLASAVTDLFGTTRWDPIELIRALRPVAEGRHLMAFSADPVEQAGWSSLSVDGALSGDETGVFWLNTGASKLDPFLDVDVEVVTTLDGEHRLVEVQVSTTNNASSALPQYTVGPWEAYELPEAGAYRGRLAWYAPNGVLDAAFVGDVDVDVFGPDGPLLLVATQPMTILPGDTVVMRFTYLLPVGREAVVVLPSGRFPATSWVWDGSAFDDAIERTVTLGGGS